MPDQLGGGGPEGSSAPRDENVFLELLAQHEAQLLGFLCAIVRNHQDAEDLFQQTVLTMWEKFQQFEAGSSFVAWGCQIARFKALNFARSRQIAPLSDEVLNLLAATQSAQDPELRHARRRALASCLEKLGASDRELVERAYERRGAVRQLAADAGRTAGSVYNSLGRIRASLYRCIQSQLAQEGLA
ncbi:MAG: sigma-70 family RNA polymerase sigma factor [Planctomycetota bacterium]